LIVASCTDFSTLVEIIVCIIVIDLSIPCGHSR